MNFIILNILNTLKNVTENNIQIEIKDRTLIVIIKDDVTNLFATKYNFQKYLPRKLDGYDKIILDFSKVNKYDTYIYLLVKKIKTISIQQKKDLEFTGLTADLSNFLDYLENIKINLQQPEVTKSNFIYKFFENTGNIFTKFIFDFITLLSLIGDIVRSTLKVVYSVRSIRWTDFPEQFTTIGVNALPISLLIVFLIGLITGYQGALQLKEFGADVYIADLISISITRELGPLMVAIIVAGRSGSAFTAEIGTMKVSEEIDALKVMGFNVIDFLVMPRLVAIIIAMPLIVILADLVGILGGLIASLATLDITAVTYFNRMQISLSLNDVFSGLIKSCVFGLVIVVIGCFRGFQVSGGAESVGRYTTSSVVTSIFNIILIDALFTLLFPIIGI